MKRNFHVHVTGILGGMAEVISAALGVKRAEKGYVKTVVIRAGQLNREGMRETLKTAIAAGANTPLVIICYVIGNDVLVDSDGPLAEAKMTFRHDCDFAVLCADSDVRGQTVALEGSAGGPGLVQLVSDVRDHLSGRQFVERDDDTGSNFDLNESPLTPAGIEPVDKIPNVSAFALHFLTDFYLSTPDRRETLVSVETINFGIDVSNNPSGHGGRPGVHAGGQS